MVYKTFKKGEVLQKELQISGEEKEERLAEFYEHMKDAPYSFKEEEIEISKKILEER